MAEYLLPHNDDIEATVLGIMIMDQAKCLDALMSLDDEDFFINNTAHRAVFRAIRTLSLKNLPIDLVSVSEQLNAEKLLDVVGGIDFLVSLTDRVTGVSNLKYYTDKLNDYALMRKLITQCADIISSSQNEKLDDFPKFVGDCEAKLMDITQKRRISGFVDATKVASEVGKQLELINDSNRSDFVGITTGYSYLDKVLNGMQKGNLIILAARPSVGKSALGLNIAYNAAKATNRPVAFFSCEMAAEELMKRLFANRATVSLSNISTGQYLTKDDRLHISEAQTEISKAKLYFDDTSNIPLEDLVTKAKKLKNDLGDLALIVIDYIGLVKVKLKTDSVNLEISRVTQTLKQLARELDCPVMALAQVNRRVEDRENAKPELSNLKDSGSIEQDADQVMFLWNPKFAVTSKKQKETQKNNNDDDIPDTINEDNSKAKGDIIELLIRKNRNGETDKTCYLMFFRDYQRFDSPSLEAIEEFKKYYKD